MTIHLIGNSHLISLRSLMPHVDFAHHYEIYAANNSAYKGGGFTFNDGLLRHSNEDVSSSWMRTSGRQEIEIVSEDTVVSIGFDDFDERYRFLSADLGFISESCLDDLRADHLRILPSFGLVEALRSGGCRARIAVVEPPLLSLDLQRAKLSGRLVNEKRYRDLMDFQRARFSENNAFCIGQSEATLGRDGESVWSQDSFMNPDGFHLGPAGAQVVLGALIEFVSASVS